MPEKKSVNALPGLIWLVERQYGGPLANSRREATPDEVEQLKDKVRGVLLSSLCGCGCGRKARAGGWLHPDCRQRFRAEYEREITVISALIWLLEINKREVVADDLRAKIAAKILLQFYDRHASAPGAPQPE